ncbi:hypothetical protein GCM10020256_01220 [Streptomyces thermocoprophilus]
MWPSSAFLPRSSVPVRQASTAATKLRSRSSARTAAARRARVSAPGAGPAPPALVAEQCQRRVADGEARVDGDGLGQQFLGAEAAARMRSSARSYSSAASGEVLRRCP